MKSTKIFNENVFGFPVTIWDLSLGFATVFIFIQLFSFLDLDDDFDTDFGADEDYSPYFNIYDTYEYSDYDSTIDYDDEDLY